MTTTEPPDSANPKSRADLRSTRPAGTGGARALHPGVKVRLPPLVERGCPAGAHGNAQDRGKTEHRMDVSGRGEQAAQAGKDHQRHHARLGQRKEVAPVGGHAQGSRHKVHRRRAIAARTTRKGRSAGTGVCARPLLARQSINRPARSGTGTATRPIIGPVTRHGGLARMPHPFAGACSMATATAAKTAKSADATFTDTATLRAQARKHIDQGRSRSPSPRTAK
jgi:hypothetical protein